MIVLSIKFLESGLALPFPDTIQRLIHHIGLAPGELNPNVWWALASSIILWKREGFPSFSFREFQFCYSLKHHPKPHEGFFDITSHPERRSPIVDNLLTTRSGKMVFSLLKENRGLLFLPVTLNTRLWDGSRRFCRWSPAMSLCACRISNTRLAKLPTSTPTSGLLLQ